MKLTVFQHAGDPAFAPIQTEFRAPGGTMGRSPENQLALPDPTGDICRVQAVLRVRDGDTTGFLMNLSSMSTVRINGQRVQCDQELPLVPGDELEIGTYRLRADSAASAATDAQAQPAAAPVIEDVFSDLIGPGTLPVGSAPDVSTHPFDLDSAAARNPDDPLRHLPRGDASVSRPVTDPLALFDAAHEGSPSVFADGTPSTLPVHDPLADHRRHPVDDALRGPRDATDSRAAADHLREIGSFMRPASVKKVPDDTDR